MTSWKYDGADAVVIEMIARARESPEQFCQRSKVGSKPRQCEVCFQEIPAWTSYHLTCSIEDNKPIFTEHHIFCPERILPETEDKS